MSSIALAFQSADEYVPVVPGEPRPSASRSTGQPSVANGTSSSTNSTLEPPPPTTTTDSITSATNLPDNVCCYCGTLFANPPDWPARTEHLTVTHKFGECNQGKKFFRADHFRQHLKHSHNAIVGKWTNGLENACMMQRVAVGTIEGPPGGEGEGALVEVGDEARAV